MNTLMQFRSLLTAPVLALLFAYGCAPAEPTGPHYDNSFWNLNPDMITDVQIDWDANGRHFHQTPGHVDPALDYYVGSTMVEAPYPIPDEVTVTWRTKDGSTHHDKVEVARRIPDIEHFKGSIFYQFRANGVSIVPRSYASQEENVRQGKAAVP